MNIDCCRFDVQIEIDVNPNELGRVAVVAIVPLRQQFVFYVPIIIFTEPMTIYFFDVHNVRQKYLNYYKVINILL